MEHIVALEPNCPPDWGKAEKCAKCGQFHLRAGYCQAVTQLPEVTLERNAGGSVTPDRNAKSLTNAERQARYRERQRAKAK